ncbi:MAG TPA: response regulator [Candidatus Peribacteria bacterium]|nr:response regulator [Candidatus Peribacteria bacterium]
MPSQQEPTPEAITPAPPVAAPVENKPADGAGKKAVLIVEDERPLAHALEMKLKNEGYVTHTCMNGTDALAELEKGGYGLVLLDLIMPVMDGFGVLAEMQQRKYGVPAIVLSNLGQEEDRLKTKQLGALDYFVKSNTPIAQIVQRVKTVL